MTRVCCLADLHGHLPEKLPPCDMVLIGGDICPNGAPLLQSIWLNSVMREWLERIQVPIVGVAGNHDFVFEAKWRHLVPKLPWVYLEDSFANVSGYKVYGSPWQGRFFDWAFNLDEDDLARKWAFIPNDVDILLLHGPPYGIGDETSRSFGKREHVGSPSLHEHIMRVKPKLCVFGHIHCSAGIYEHNDIIFVNAALAGEGHTPEHEPIVVEIK